MEKNGSRNKRRDGKIRNISGVMGHLREDFKLDEMLEISGVMSSWKSIVGERVGAHTKPEFIQKRILYIKSDGAAWMQEFNFTKNETIRKLNRELGRPLIRDIRFKN